MCLILSFLLVSIIIQKLVFFGQIDFLHMGIVYSIFIFRHFARFDFDAILVPLFGLAHIRWTSKYDSPLLFDSLGPKIEEHGYSKHKDQKGYHEDDGIVVRFWLVWVMSGSHDLSISCSLVETYQKAIVVVIESGVEVPEENGSESILVKAIWDRLNTDEAIFLACETIEVAHWLDLNFGVMKHEFQIVQSLGQSITGKTADKNLITFNFPCFNAAILFHHKSFQLNKFGMRHLNRSIT